MSGNSSPNPSFLHESYPDIKMRPHWFDGKSLFLYLTQALRFPSGRGGSVLPLSCRPTIPLLSWAFDNPERDEREQSLEYSFAQRPVSSDHTLAVLDDI